MAFFSSRRHADSDSNESDTRIQPLAPSQSPIGFSTVLGANSDLEGRLSSEGNVRLDGKFTGTLDISGNVLVGETARINADIDARNISIAGAVRGNVRGNKVQLLRTGRVWGDISARALMTEEGAFIDGRITMMGHAASDTPDQTTIIDDELSADETLTSDEEPLLEVPVFLQEETIEDTLSSEDSSITDES